MIAEAVVDEEFLVQFDLRDPGTAPLCMEKILETVELEPEDVIAEDAALTEGDRIIVLYTCIGGRPTDRRIIVAKLVEQIRVEGGVRFAERPVREAELTEEEQSEEIGS